MSRATVSSGRVALAAGGARVLKGDASHSFPPLSASDQQPGARVRGVVVGSSLRPAAPGRTLPLLVG